MEAARAKEAKKPKKKRIKRIRTEDVVLENGFAYTRYVNPPEDLVPTEEHIGKYLESCDGKKSKNKYYRLMRFNNDKVVTLVDDQGVTMSKYLESVILHRNEGIRNQESEFDRLASMAGKRRRRK